MPFFKSVSDLERHAQELKKARSAAGRLVSICAGTGCLASGGDKVLAAFEEAVKKGKVAGVTVKGTGCPGFCEHGPLVEVLPDGYLYTKVKVEDVSEIIDTTILGKKPVERLLFKDKEGTQFIKAIDVPFYAKQQRILLANQNVIDPASLDDYIAVGGYTALAKALTKMKPDAIIKGVSDSILRGRGGAGYPTGKKWEEVARQKNPVRYLICNADEGDPGAFMDRALLEGNPHLIMEGMIIGAFAMGSHAGYVYVREEYPVAVKNLGIAIEAARKAGLLGKNILGTGFDFDLFVYRGAGAFVCGESSALINSIMGMAGEPKQKPPRNAVKGLWDCPTNINNVETWANVPHIINNGAAWFANIGTKTSTGTKIFSLVGKINNTGLVDVPMGVTLRHIVFVIGGGVPDGKKFKAVQTGGPSGGCIPESQLDLSVDYDSLKAVGSIMGSGGMIVMDEDTCMVNIAKYFTDFNLDESCGKCVSCREGLFRLSEILTRITKGNGTPEDKALLQELSEYVIETSLCGLGNSAPNPVKTTLKYFENEYDEHILHKRCPAKVCKDLVVYHIDQKKCIGCGACKKACPSGAVTGAPKQKHEIDQSKCIHCGQCHSACPKKVQAVYKADRYPAGVDP